MKDEEDAHAGVGVQTAKSERGGKESEFCFRKESATFGSFPRNVLSFPAMFVHYPATFVHFRQRSFITRQPSFISRSPQDSLVDNFDPLVIIT